MKSLIRAVLTISVMSVVSSCSYINPYLGLEDNNVLEELGERILKNETGLDVNFSDTPEEVEDEG